jgi:hypothetical protein
MNHLPPAPFIVGADRSGTTLLQAMLDAHPDLAIPPETYWLPEVIPACRATPEAHEAFVRFVEQRTRWPLFGLTTEQLRMAVFAVQPFDVVEAMRAVYRLYAQLTGKPRWGDKTPRYLIRLPLVTRLFPEAHIIHVIRDGRDQALSILAAPWGPQTVPEAAKRWHNEVRWARWAGQQVRHYQEVRYEALVSMPEQVLRDICRYIDLPWHPQMLEYPSYSRAANNAAYLNLTQNPLLRSAPQPKIGRWRTEMADADIRQYEAEAGNLLDELGYPLGRPVGPPTRLRWRLTATLRQLRWQLRWQLRQSRSGLSGSV